MTIEAITLRLTAQGVHLDIRGRSIQLTAATTQVGLKMVLIPLLAEGHLTPEEVVPWLAVQEVTVVEYLARYQADPRPLALLDRRWQGQQRAYKMGEEQQGTLLYHLVMRLVREERISGAALAEALRPAQGGALSGEAQGAACPGRQARGGGVHKATVNRHLRRNGYRRVADRLTADVARVLAEMKAQAVQQALEQLRAEGWYTPQDPTQLELLDSRYALVPVLARGLVRLDLWRVVQELFLEDLSPRETTNERFFANLVWYLAATQGERLSHAERMPIEELRGLLAGQVGLSASFLTTRLSRVVTTHGPLFASPDPEVTSPPTGLWRFKVTAIAAAVQSEVVETRVCALDSYVNPVWRQENLVRAKQGTWQRVVKAFLRHPVVCLSRHQPVTCFLTPAGVAPEEVLRRSVALIWAGLAQAQAEGHLAVAPRLERMIIDRWWSNSQVLGCASALDLGLVMWAKEDATVRQGIEAATQEGLWQQVWEGEGPERRLVREYQDTQVRVYDLSKPQRMVILREPEQETPRAFYLAGVPTTVDWEQGQAELSQRGWVESLIQQLLRHLHWRDFAGGQAYLVQPGLTLPEGDELKKLRKHLKQVATRQRKAQAQLDILRDKQRRLEAGETPSPDSDGFVWGVWGLKAMIKRLEQQVDRLDRTGKHLRVTLAWAEGRGPAPEVEPVYELDLSREEIISQLKLMIETATRLVEQEFIERCLQPVLWEEATAQAQARQAQGCCGRNGQPLCTDVEELYRRKVASLDREAIRQQLLHSGGYLLVDHQQQVIISIACRLRGERMRKAYRRYCTILNDAGLKVPIDRDVEYRLLFALGTWEPDG